METLIQTNIDWHQACQATDVPADGGACVLIDGQQIAIYNFSRRGQWFATQNECPHKQQMALSRGLIGSILDEPKVACPFHKKTFSLKTGACLSGEEYHIKTFPIKEENGFIFIGILKMM
jgi:nitrite reductase (NADH) small subunit